jgi:hypothetical protein
MTIDHARQQQRECADYILGGGDRRLSRRQRRRELRGARLGMYDWFTEEYLLTQEASNGSNANDKPI